MQHQVELLKRRAGEGNYNQMRVWMFYIFPCAHKAIIALCWQCEVTENHGKENFKLEKKVSNKDFKTTLSQVLKLIFSYSK